MNYFRGIFLLKNNYYLYRKLNLMKSILNALIVVLIILLFWYLVFALLQFNINPNEWDKLVFYLYLIVSIPSSLYGFLKVCAEY